MFLAETNKIRNLLHLSFIARVSVADLEHGVIEVPALLADLTEGFRLLTDLSHLDAMEPGCEIPIGQIMDLCKAHGVGRIVRIIPDPKKDIGLTILSRFHYGRGARVTTCESLAQVAKMLAH